MREVVPLVEKFALSRLSVVGIAPVFLTQRFSSSQMFSIMFKSGDLVGRVDDIHIVCIQICSGGPCQMGWSTTMQQLHSSVVSQQWNDLRIVSSTSC